MDAGEGKSPLSLNPSADDFRSFHLFNLNICSFHLKNVSLRWILGTTTGKPRLTPRSRRLFGLLGKKIERPFSLFRRGRLKNALGRFPGLSLTYSPRLPMSLRLTVTCVAAFVAFTVAGPRRILTGLPRRPKASKKTAQQLYRLKKIVKV